MHSRHDNQESGPTMDKSMVPKRSGVAYSWLKFRSSCALDVGEQVCHLCLVLLGRHLVCRRRHNTQCSITGSWGRPQTSWHRAAQFICCRSTRERRHTNAFELQAGLTKLVQGQRRRWCRIHCCNAGCWGHDAVLDKQRHESASRLLEATLAREGISILLRFSCIR